MILLTHRILHAMKYGPPFLRRSTNAELLAMMVYRGIVVVLVMMMNGEWW